eukprot:1716961-Rhodomonas_salina.3
MLDGRLRARGRVRCEQRSGNAGRNLGVEGGVDNEGADDDPQAAPHILFLDVELLVLLPQELHHVVDHLVGNVPDVRATPMRARVVNKAQRPVASRRLARPCPDYAMPPPRFVVDGHGLGQPLEAILVADPRSALAEPKGCDGRSHVLQRDLHSFSIEFARQLGVAGCDVCDASCPERQHVIVNGLAKAEPLQVELECNTRVVGTARGGRHDGVITPLHVVVPRLLVLQFMLRIPSLDSE